MIPLALNLPNLTFRSEENGKPCHKHIMDGEEVPGCTSISGLFQDDGWKFAWPPKIMEQVALQKLDAHWRRNGDINYSQVQEIITSSKNAWRRKRDKSADTGVIAHGIIEQFIKTGEPQPRQKDPEVHNCFDQFLEWVAKYNPLWIGSEIQVGSVVHRFAGILDALADIGGQLTLVDFKTSAEIKDDYAIQLAGLCICLEEMGVKVSQRAILHLPKTGPYEFRIIDSDLEKDKAAFLAALEFYDHKNLFMARMKKEKK